MLLRSHTHRGHHVRGMRQIKRAVPTLPKWCRRRRCRTHVHDSEPRTCQSILNKRLIHHSPNLFRQVHRWFHCICSIPHALYQMFIQPRNQIPTIRKDDIPQTRMHKHTTKPVDIHRRITICKVFRISHCNGPCRMNRQSMAIRKCKYHSGMRCSEIDMTCRIGCYYSVDDRK